MYDIRQCATRGFVRQKDIGARVSINAGKTSTFQTCSLFAACSCMLSGGREELVIDSVVAVIEEEFDRLGKF